jgi:predicted NUDIX family NTP pyrophosphohydrolase
VAARRSAGILLYREGDDASGGLEVLVAHMGGPFFERKDAAAWTVPKGEYDDDEPALSAARREFHEELGLPVPDVALKSLGEVRQANGKVVTVWAGRADLDLSGFDPGTFEMEWPKGSGRLAAFPEVDRAAWWPVDEARPRLVAAQREFLDRLVALVGG